MKKIILAAIAASVVAAPLATSPALAAPGHDNRGRVEQQHRNNDRFEAPQRRRGQSKEVTQRRHATASQTRWPSRQAVQHRNWRKGEHFDSRQARNYRVIANPRADRLRDAPRGYRWVQSGNDAVLVAIHSGIIGAVVANIL